LLVVYVDLWANAARDPGELIFYQKAAKRKVTAQAAKNALDALRQRVPSLVWKSARGEYAVDDVARHRWYEQRVVVGKWPPQGMADNL
jgi:hypothetical protein